MRNSSIIPIMLSTLLLASCAKEAADDRNSDTTVTTTATATTIEAETTTAATTLATTTKATTAKTTTTAAATTAAATTTEKTTEAPTAPATEPDPDAEDKEILKSINELREIYDYFYPDHQPDGTLTHYTSDGELVDYKNLENYMVYEAGTIPIDRVLGSITSEQDVIDKAREVLINGKGQEYIDWLEKEPEPDNGVRYIRDYPSIKAIYYEEYDTWCLYPTAPAWTKEDGTAPHKAAWSEGPCFMYIRGSDGKLLGTCINY